MPSRFQNVRQVFRLLLIDGPEHPLGQHFREPDDGVQRRAELMGHVGKKLRLVTARGLKLAALVRDLVEEPGVLDGQGRLRREGLQDVHDLRRKLAGGLPVEG